MKNILFIVMLYFSVSALSAEEKTRSVSLGAVASLTGPASEQGGNWVKGATLAVKHLKEREGIEVTLAIEDDRTLPVQAIAAFEKLVAVNKVQGIIGGTWDYLAEAIAPLAVKHKIAVITPSNPVEMLSASTRRNPWFFSNGLSIAATEAAIENAITDLNIKTAAIVVPNVPFGIAHAEAIERIASRLAIKIVYRTDFELSGYQEILRNAALKISVLKPDMVFVHTEYASLFAIVKEFHQRKVLPWIVTSQHLDQAVKLSGNAVFWKKTIGISPLSTNQKFIEEYTREYKSAPRVFASEGYDAATFLGRALSNGVSLADLPFETAGLEGQLRSSPGMTEIFHYEAVAMIVSDQGELVRK